MQIEPCALTSLFAPILTSVVNYVLVQFSVLVAAALDPSEAIELSANTFGHSSSRCVCFAFRDREVVFLHLFVACRSTTSDRFAAVVLFFVIVVVVVVVVVVGVVVVAVCAPAELKPS
ncbi:unnamed protein product [Polarella glacialis]|uniref:Transmembrane protein n=1 Tax=Polarella glacialis TaxID=89957 RepID=A0A813HCG1_POLGL|nr:unnamed protein product [Polarella glacialis]